MARREHLSNWPCGHPGCKERGLYAYPTLRELREAVKRYAKEPWRCTRHSQPDEVLSAKNPVRHVELVASKVRCPGYDEDLRRYERRIAEQSPYPGRRPDEFLPGLFWIGDGEARSGFTYGPGFRAFATDFPEGTKLLITAEIEIPESADG